ncbi:hypothetical protein BDZ89DRAFT_1038426, partial [Hymenopellis radicata]
HRLLTLSLVCSDTLLRHRPHLSPMTILSWMYSSTLTISDGYPLCDVLMIIGVHTNMLLTTYIYLRTRLAYCNDLTRLCTSLPNNSPAYEDEHSPLHSRKKKTPNGNTEERQGGKGRHSATRQ